LWIGRGRNPDRQSLRIEVSDLLRRVFGNIGEIAFEYFRLHALRRDVQTPPSRLAKKPVPIRRRLSVGGMKCRFPQCVLKNLLRFGGVSRHQKTKSIELRESSGRHY
jgi:hypothetical protein